MLWAVTSYFNPAGYRRKLSNYRVFRRHLDIPLVAVELAHGDGFELAAGDADRLVQLRGGDVMWQKERLLNVAIGRVPDDCRFVAWIDCDVLFTRKDWPDAAIARLQTAELCQLYDTVFHLASDVDRPEGSAAILQHRSFGFAEAAGLSSIPASVMDGVPSAFKRGHAWAARRDVLDRCGLYDRNVVGGGDRAMAFAATGRWQEIIACDAMAPGHAEDYRRWASEFHETLHGGVSYVEGDIYHLWHGDLRDRQYSQRLRILSAFDYDPAVDIVQDAEGGWRWSSPKYEMHRQIHEYFLARDEDGERRTH